MNQATNVNIVPSYGQRGDLHFSQYDVGRTATINLYAVNEAYTIPVGATVKIQATKPSGLGFDVACTFSGSVVTVVSTETMTEEAGRFPCELRITKDSDVIGTANFMFVVEPSPHPDGVIDGDAEEVVNEIKALVLQSEGYALGTQDGVPVDNTSPYYENNAKWFAENISLTDDFKQALLNCFENVAWIGNDGQDYYDALYDALYPHGNLLSISAAYTNSSTNVPIDASMKKLAYINAAGVWTISNESVSLAVPVTVGKAYKLDWSTTDSTLVGEIFRWAFCNTDTPSGQTLTAWNRYTPQSRPSVTVRAVDNYMVLQFSSAYGDAIISNNYLSITEYDNSIFDFGTLDSLKSNLTVTAVYDDQTVTLTDNDYTLSGNLDIGLNTITVTYEDKTDTFTSVVTAPLYSIPDFAETTISTGKIKKVNEVYTITGKYNNVFYVYPAGTVSTSKSNTLWFPTPDKKPLLNKVYDITWSNPNTTKDVNLHCKYSRSNTTGNLASASFLMTANGSGTNGSAEYTSDSYNTANLSSLALQTQGVNGDFSAESVSCTFRVLLSLDGLRYL